MTLRATVELRCNRVEVINKQKHILFGVFYRPPSADSQYFTAIETSLNLAVDTGYTDIIVTGDFNFNMLSPPTARKINFLCTELALHQAVDEPTHYTESSSLIDLILVHNQNNLIACGVGDPFLEQTVRYHCPVFGLMKFSKPKAKSYTRQIWDYEQGDFQLLRTKAAETEWDSLRNNNLDTYATNISYRIMAIAKQCIPNKVVTIKPSDPRWLTTKIKQFIRKRKRAQKSKTNKFTKSLG